MFIYLLLELCKSRNQWLKETYVEFMWLFMLEAEEHWQLEGNSGKFQKIHLKISLRLNTKKGRDFQVLEMVKVAS